MTLHLTVKRKSQFVFAVYLTIRLVWWVASFSFVAVCDFIASAEVKLSLR